MDAPILFERRDGIAVVTLNTPDKGNAIDLVMARALLDVAIACDHDAAIRCVVLKASGRLFCAGGDIGLMQTAGDAVGGALSELAGTLHMAVSRLARMAKPLLCVVQGPAAGAGLGLAVMGDVVIAARSAHFTAAYGAIGLTPDGAATWLLPRLVGLRRAQEMILTNRRVTADDGAAMGLITRAVDDDQLEAEAEMVAAKLAQAATGAIGAARGLLLDCYGAGLEAQMEREARSIAAAGAGPEGREGVAAFLAKRRPDFGQSGS